MSHFAVTKKRDEKTRRKNKNQSASCVPEKCLVQTPIFQHPGWLWRQVYASANRCRCRLSPFGLCANLTYCNERAAQHAVPSIAVEIRVNQPENTRLAMA